MRLEAERNGDKIGLRVTDERPRLPGRLPVARAFERLSRADGARTGGGAGLGLAIVKAVAEAHGGRAEAGGATVTIVVPLEHV